MIKAVGVNKFFDTFQALKDINFEIGKGEIVGFLGQNGAGKTTLMRLLTSYLSPSSGHIQILGKDIIKEALAVRREIGYLPETPPLYLQMRVWDYLKFAAQLKGVASRQVKQALERVLADCQLESVARSPIYKLSKGYKQRTGVAQALVHDPAILILDEPTSGLDPIQVHQMRRIIKGVNPDRTVILSTHILSEMEELAGRIFMIKEGRILADQNLETLIQESGSLEKAFLNRVAV